MIKKKSKKEKPKRRKTRHHYNQQNDRTLMTTPLLHIETLHHSSHMFTKFNTTTSHNQHTHLMNWRISFYPSSNYHMVWFLLLMLCVLFFYQIHYLMVLYNNIIHIVLHVLNWKKQYWLTVQWRETLGGCIQTSIKT